VAIQWFPGHMHSTKKAIALRVKEIDVVIELLDARLPGSSCNPMLAQLTAGKANLKVLNKQDVADPIQTAAWLAFYNAQPETKAIALDASEPAPAKALVNACIALKPNRGGVGKPMRILICGVPNVGKSTLINTIAGKRAAKTGDEAGITKLEQRIILAHNFYLFDTPGVLWPRIIVPQSGFNLAASGAIGVNAYDEEEVALELLAYLKTRYSSLLETRYQLTGVAQTADEDLLLAIGRRRGAVKAGHKINLQNAAQMVIDDFRSAAFGRVTLETPSEFALWLAAGQEQDKLRVVRKEAVLKPKKKTRLENPVK
jgi:ribosome biogenesis GTPase A